MRGRTEHNKKKKDITQMAPEKHQSKGFFFSLFKIQLHNEVLRTKIKGRNVGLSEVHQQGVFLLSSISLCETFLSISHKRQ